MHAHKLKHRINVIVIEYAVIHTMYRVLEKKLVICGMDYIKERKNKQASKIKSKKCKNVFLLE